MREISVKKRWDFEITGQISKIQKFWFLNSVFGPKWLKF